MDNASTDSTRNILIEAAAGFPNARVETVETIGLGVARDANCRVAKGDVVLFTDDDCHVAADIVDATVAVFAK